MPTPVIVAATRTPIGTLGGALSQIPATKLGAIAVREAMKRANLDPALVEEVILGHVLPAGLGLNPRSAITPRIRSRVSGRTTSLPLRTRDAVATLTPASRATSRMVTDLRLMPLLREDVTGYMRPVTLR